MPGGRLINNHIKTTLKVFWFFLFKDTQLLAIVAAKLHVLPTMTKQRNWLSLYTNFLSKLSFGCIATDVANYNLHPD